MDKYKDCNYVNDIPEIIANAIRIGLENTLEIYRK